MFLYRVFFFLRVVSPHRLFVLDSPTKAVLVLVGFGVFFFSPRLRLVPADSAVWVRGCPFVSAFAGGSGYAASVRVDVSCSASVLFLWGVLQ